MAKRTNGEGTVGSKPLADGRWQARYTATDATGRVHRKAVYGKTREEAARKLREALGRRDAGIASPGPETVGAFLAAWLEGVRPTLRPRTWERYEQQIRLELVPLLGRRSLARLAPEDVQRAYASLLARGLSPATVRRSHATLHRALEQAVRWRKVPTNVAGLVNPPRVAHRDMATLTPEQARHLVAAVAGERLEALYVLAVTAGLRQGELLALRWSDVDLDRRTVAVTAGLVRVYKPRSAAREEGEARSHLELTEPKTARSRRRVELTAVAVEALRRRRAAWLEERVAAANVWQDRDLVFCSPTGGYLHAARLSKQFADVLRRADLPRIRFHDLRHTAATLMLGQGVHPKVASEMLGHATVSVTLDLYSHVTETMQRGAAEALDSVFAD
ncbi:MAG: site-specific integrase [Candidatus Dormibacteria bacterium]|jgi:integrase|nr:site-specific integrase [Chloroflexota bacterium]